MQTLKFMFCVRLCENITRVSIVRPCEISNYELVVNCQLAAELLREIVGEGRLKAKVEPLLT